MAKGAKGTKASKAKAKRRKTRAAPSQTATSALALSAWAFFIGLLTTCRHLASNGPPTECRTPRDKKSSTAAVGGGGNASAEPPTSPPKQRGAMVMEVELEREVHRIRSRLRTQILPVAIH